MKRKKLMITMMFIAIVGIILLPNKVKAVTLQANGGTPAKYTINDWLLYIRQMQSTGGALGLSDTINSDLTSTNTNLDIHMQKNTEYGAMAILSASAYGMGSTPIKDGETTTGNATGIKININKEWVSAGCTELSTNVARFGSAAERYKNIYTTGTVGGKVGDAIQTVGTWHGASDCAWIQRSSWGVLVRSRSGSLFSYFGRGGYTSAGREPWDGLCTNAWSCRAVVVVGSGL